MWGFKHVIVDVVGGGGGRGVHGNGVNYTGEGSREDGGFTIGSLLTVTHFLQYNSLEFNGRGDNGMVADGRDWNGRRHLSLPPLTYLTGDIVFVLVT